MCAHSCHRLADAIVRRGFLTDAAVLDKGLHFVDPHTARKQLAELGLSLAHLHSVESDGQLSRGKGSERMGRKEGEKAMAGIKVGRVGAEVGLERVEICVDLLSLVCARGYSECAVALLQKHRPFGLPSALGHLTCLSCG